MFKCDNQLTPPSSDPKNTVILPGYCVAGTVGAKVLAGQKTIAIDKHTSVDVQMDVQNLSFSAHADAKGIMDLIRMARPRHVMLVRMILFLSFVSTMF